MADIDLQIGEAQKKLAALHDRGSKDPSAQIGQSPEWRRAYDDVVRLVKLKRELEASPPTSTAQPTSTSQVAPPSDVDMPRPMPKAVSSPALPSSSPATASEGPSQAKPTTNPSNGGGEPPKTFWTEFKDLFRWKDQNTSDKSTKETESERASSKSGPMSQVLQGISYGLGVRANKSSGVETTHLEKGIAEDRGPVAGTGTQKALEGVPVVGGAISSVVTGIRTWGHGVSQVASSVIADQFTENPADRMENVGRGISGLGNMLLPMMPFADAPGKMVSAIGETINKLNEFSNKMHTTNMSFAEFSSGMSAVAANARVQEIYLSQERGERRAEAADNLQQARNRRHQAQAQLEDSFHNRIGSPVMSEVEHALATGMEWIAKQMGIDPNKMDPGPSFEEWANDITEPAFLREYGRPMMFGNMNGNGLRRLVP